MTHKQQATKCLQDTFGFSAFKHGQEDVIDRLLEGHSTLAIFPTGQGKSLCYQLPALLLPHLTLVVSPLMALMKDQQDFLQTKNIGAARLDSSLTAEENRAVYENIRNNKLKILFVAPERFNNERFLALLKQITISLLVIDEAHCISEWGHNFRPDYLKLQQIATDLEVPAILGLTATATPEVANDICHSFNIEPENLISTGFHRPNLTLEFSPSDDALGVLFKRLRKRPAGPTIVYVTLQKTAEEVANSLTNNGHDAKPYHAGLKDALRKEIQDWFMASQAGIVVATIAFGMGIDKSNIRYVYHYNLPKSLENYAQEIGRAGRDGQPAICEMLGSPDDLIVLENFIYGDTPDKKAVTDLTAYILARKETFSVSTYELSRQFDMRPLVVKTLLTYLELDGLIAATAPFHTSYKFIPYRSSTEIFAPFNKERRQFLSALFSCALKKRTWFTLDLDKAMEKTGSDRGRIISALGYLEEQGDLTLQATGFKQGYRLLKSVDDDEKFELTARLNERFVIREQNDIDRLQQVVEMVNEPSCKTAFLLDHFGSNELEGNCGHCATCLKHQQSRLGFGEHRQEVDKEILVQAKQLANEYPHSLNSPRRLACFFCGIYSTSQRADKLSHHPL